MASFGLHLRYNTGTNLDSSYWNCTAVVREVGGHADLAADQTGDLRGRSKLLGLFNLFFFRLFGCLFSLSYRCSLCWCFLFGRLSSWSLFCSFCCSSRSNS